MEVMAQTLEQIYGDIVNSVGYRTTVGPIDKGKVERRRAGVRTNVPSARLARAAWRVAGLLAPVLPPPPPPPYKKVAPRVAYKQDGSDARYCLVNQPGVGLQPDGTYRDEVAQYAPDGLCLGSERSSGSAADGIVGAKEMDGRAPCSLPMPGDPTKNTGSWKI